MGAPYLRHVQRTGDAVVKDGMNGGEMDGALRVPCHIFENTSVDKLAAICRGIDQNVVGWKTLDKWKIRLLAREEAPLKIEATLKRNGLRVDKTRGPGVVQAVSACETVYLKAGNESVLDKTLTVLRAAYGDDPDAFDKALILGVGHLAHLFDGRLDLTDLSHKLSRYSGPSRIVGQARDKSKTDGMSVHRAVAERVLSVYNSGRRIGRLAL